MNLKESGKLITKCRKEAGYTQQSLADILHVTDKAVSKWERGICVPDASLLAKLSMLLDVDIESLISGKDYYNVSKDWKGLLIVDDIDYDLYDKPVIFYFLSYFLLVGINNIEIISNNSKYIKNLNLKKYGINIVNSCHSAKNTMIVYDKVFLFGGNLTRQISDAMEKKKNTVFMLDKKELPIVLKVGANDSIESIRSNCEIKKLNRGMISIILNNKRSIKDASEFVRIYQKNHSLKIADLQEIKENRNYSL